MQKANTLKRIIYSFFKTGALQLLGLFSHLSSHASGTELSLHFFNAVTIIGSSNLQPDSSPCQEECTKKYSPVGHLIRM